MNSYSFTKPRLKPLLSLFSKLWIGFIVFTILLFLLIKISIGLYSGFLEDENIVKQDNYDQIVQKIETIKSDNKFSMKQKKAIENIHASNIMLKKSITNIFHLVPDAIYLNSVFMDDNELRLKGSTPSKDMYKLLLGAPLKSIFHSSKASFYQTSSGWLNFVTINKTENSKEGK